MSGPRGKPSLDVFLQSGDSLYIPRGWTFSLEGAGAGPGAGEGSQAKGGAGESLLMRVCTNRDHTHADLLELLLPTALEAASERLPSFRRGLPRDAPALLGVANSELDEADAQAQAQAQAVDGPGRGKGRGGAGCGGGLRAEGRAALLASIESKMQALARIAVDLADAAFDQLSRRFLSERLPPFLNPHEEAASAAALAPRIAPFTRLRMLRPGLACAVVEDGVVVVYHCVDNSRELFGAPLNPLTFELDDGPCVEALLRAYPHPVTVQTLPHPSEEDGDRVEVAQALFKEGFLVIDDEATLPSHLHEGQDEDGEDDSPF